MSAIRILRPVVLATAIISAVAAAASEAAPRDLTVGSPGQHKQHQKPLRPLNLSLIPTTSALTIGGTFGLRMRSTADGFGHLYVLSASGKVQLWFENLPVQGMRSFSYPASGLKVRAAPPAGDETIVFIVTRERFDGFAGRGTARNPVALQHTDEDFNEALEEKTAALRRAQWAIARSTIRIGEAAH